MSPRRSARPTRRGGLAVFACAALVALAAAASQPASQSYRRGASNDPRLRSAGYLGEDQRHLSALIELLQMHPDGTPIDQAPPEYWWMLADNYLSFGLRDRADAIYQQLALTHPDPLRLSRARLRLARFEYERGYLPEARATLLRLREQLPKSLLLEWQDLLARVLMSQGRHGEAIEVLTEPKNGADQSDYTQYNLGIALINDGRDEQGRTVLDRIGRQRMSDRDSMALADRANMTLGWNFLQERQGAVARPILRRVRAEGLYSNRALLGLGWAELAPQGSRQRRDDVDDGRPMLDEDPFGSSSRLSLLLQRALIEEPAPLLSFRRSSGASDQEEALRRALAPWLILAERDPQDPAVQEGWLAIAYALDQLGAHEQAREYYERAVVGLEEARRRTNVAIEALKTHRMVETILRRDLDAESGWNWELKDLPDAPETYYLQTLLAEHRFAEALKNYRDVRLLARNLDAWDRRIRDMEKAYTTAQRPSVYPPILFARAKENYEPPRPDLQLRLTTAIQLSAPGRYRAPAPQAKLPPPALKLSELPPAQRFIGTFERLGDLKKRLAQLRPQLARTGDRQARLLQRIASEELQAQKKQIEKYLVEARFALARLYDRALPTADPDEYEIEK